MSETKLKRFCINFCLIAAILFSLYYLYDTHFTFMLSLFHYKMLNSSSVSYTIMRFLYVLLPIFIMVPPLYMEKINRVKISFYLLGILYFVGTTWIFYFLRDHPLSYLENTVAVQGYLQLRALNFDYLIWDLYDLWGPIFSIITGSIYIALGYFIDKRVDIAVLLFWLTTIISVALPFLYNYVIAGINDISILWLRKNTIIFISGFLMNIATTIMATSERLWGDYIWN